MGCKTQATRNIYTGCFTNLGQTLRNDWEGQMETKNPLEFIAWRFSFHTSNVCEDFWPLLTHQHATLLTLFNQYY